MGGCTLDRTKQMSWCSLEHGRCHVICDVFVVEMVIGEVCSCI